MDEKGLTDSQYAQQMHTFNISSYNTQIPHKVKMFLNLTCIHKLPEASTLKVLFTTLQSKIESCENVTNIKQKVPQLVKENTQPYTFRL